MDQNTQEFAFPILTETEMSFEKQKELIAIQATSSIVASYLQYCISNNATFETKEGLENMIIACKRGLMKTL